MKEQDFTREDGRKNDEKRQVSITTGYLDSNPHSVLISVGRTRVLCAATSGNWMPPHVKDTGKGWVGAQYCMLPNSSPQRVLRERNKVSGRTKEIERLIGRSLRSVCELKAIPYESIIVDCDVIQADGGTRTASVTGGFIALYMLLKDMQKSRRITRFPITDFLAGISVGIVHGQPCLDLCSSEDMTAQVDMNMVMSESGRLSEVQATGEEATFKKEQLDEMMALAGKGIKELIKEQKKALGIL
ncbi:MAG: ribonuclease PH [Elusimicrobia bacterium]|nr:ribonuclease PH [Elusimicrobiota bacterium]